MLLVSIRYFLGIIYNNINKNFICKTEMTNCIMLQSSPEEMLQMTDPIRLMLRG